MQNEVGQIEELVEEPEPEAVPHGGLGVPDLGNRFPGQGLAPVEVFDEAVSLFSRHDPMVAAIDEVGQN